VGLLAAGVHGAPASPGLPLVLTRVPARAGLPTPAALNEAEIVRVSPDGKVTPLASEFQAACDPAVSHDARRLLFAGKTAAGAPWQIYELDLASGKTRQITHDPLDARQPVYLSHLFTLDSPKPWATLLYVATEPKWNLPGTARIRGLRNVRLDGSEPRQVTLNPADNLDPFQAADGRVLYSSQHFTPDGRDERRLFAVNIDGVDYALYGAEQGRRYQRMPCVTDRGVVVFVESDREQPDGAGQLACVKEQRPHHSYRPLTRDADRLYRDPAPVPGGAVLVSRRVKGRPGTALVRFDPATGKESVVLADPAFHLLQARVLRPRPLPDGRSTSVNTDFKSGVLYSLNCYDADARFGGHLKPGVIRALRVIAGVASEKPAPLARRVLGVLPVEPDGSFSVKVPADLPVKLQILDANGLALATCDWIWVKQKENRGCIGCHADPERAPENLFVEAMHHEPRSLDTPPKRWRAVGFREDVFPLLQRRCGTAGCHGGPDAGWQMPAGPDAADATCDLLTDHYVHPGRARTSPLVWHLLGRNTARPWDHDPHAGRPVKRMPPGKGNALNEVELRRVTEWIDLGAPPRRQPAPTRSN
jgi:hypothetical protein